MKQEISQKVMSLAKRRGFLWPSFEIYGGTSGFFDYGPLGVALKRNFEDLWRYYYICIEEFLEIQTTKIMPEEVFRASGHLEEFTDFMVECQKCGESFRADTLLEGIVENPDGMSAGEIDRAIEEHGVRCPSCHGSFGGAHPFNLMFRTSIGPGTGKAGYLRPETAQGMFINFPALFRMAREKMPVGVVQIGTVFRNEISPRQGVLRVREFNQAEAEVFVLPDGKTHPGFERVASDVYTFIPQDGEERQMTVREAVESSLVSSQMLGYYIGVTGRILTEAGIDRERMRFRQHRREEMAHYAADCWDAEALTSYGWVELVGIADRTDYDLRGHEEHSGTDMKVFVQYDSPVEVTVRKVMPKHAVLGPIFKGRTGKVASALEALNPDDVQEGEPIELDVDGERVTVPPDAWTLVERDEVRRGERVMPHVIEPSYGIDRILYTILEHAYTTEQKEGEVYTVLRLRPWMAPISAGVFPLVSRGGLPDKAKEIYWMLRKSGMMVYYDEGGSIGRRYARMDEIGTPCCITVDFDTLKDDTVTVRDRDTREQVRIGAGEVLNHVRKIIQRVE